MLILLRRIIFCCNGPLLKSKNLYFILSSSPPSVSSSIVNGGVFDSFRMVKVWTSISMSPVLSLGFLLVLSFTTPLIWITHSLLISLALLQRFSSFDSLKVNCVIPYRSLKSIKVIPPRSLFFWTQPHSITLRSTSDKFRLSLLCVLYINILLKSFQK